jgi:rhodanese-related sulfurtransferase
MTNQITREDVQRMTAEGAVLIDTLSENEYAEEHIAGAINIPLKKLDRQTTAHLSKGAPIIVYCYDTD